MTTTKEEAPAVPEIVEEGVASAAPPALDMAAILAAIQSTVTAVVAPLQSRLDEMEERTAPQFVNRAGDVDIPERLVDEAGLTGNNKTVNVTADGQFVDSNVLMGLRPQFRPGGLVRLSPRADHGDAESVAAMLARTGSRGIGRVERVVFLDNHNGRPQWKYRVRIPGLTNANGNGYWAEELEAVL